ncbi:MAG: dihydrodipicolinate synthase family protein [Candidatus Dormiibacterota bacterium]
MDTADRLDRALQGVIPPLITPLTAGGGLDEEALVRHAQHCLDAGCTGVFLSGSSGEGPWLTAAQRRRIVEAVAARGTLVLAGTMLPGTSMTREAALEAEAAGAAAIVVSAPYYFGADEDTIVRHVEAVVEAVTVPALLYNIPQLTHNPMTAGVVARLAADPRIVGIKDSSGDRALFASHLEIREQHPFRVLQGAEERMGDSLRAGADGLVPGLANVAPELFVALQQAVIAGDGAAADAEQTISRLRGIYDIAPTFAAMKAACEVLGVCGRTPAAPLAPATEPQVERIAQLLTGVGLMAATA